MKSSILQAYFSYKSAVSKQMRERTRPSEGAVWGPCGGREGAKKGAIIVQEALNFSPKELDAESRLRVGRKFEVDRMETYYLSSGLAGWLLSFHY
jgi:hypothetical protein